MKMLDANQMSITNINRSLREAGKKGEPVLVSNTLARHHLAVGILAPVQVTFVGSVGYYSASLSDGPSIRVKGSAGWFAADNFMAGQIVVEKDVGNCAAPGMRGGSLIVRGNLGSRAGQVMKSGTILVGGNAGFMTGFMLFDGRIVIVGDTGELLGHYMIGGQIFVAGQIASLGTDAVEAEVTAEDSDFLSEILERYEFPHPGRFRKIISGRKYHHIKRG
ncbi:tributyrin esterase [Heliobacterium chlorum]|uniref:Tributyrin esterase n=1 Tax=Heliobacterium chlorum TaxID=2698 RepID=A0ABR7T5D6_HELCL|nr:tributyrin esterase [Heliobacterium chlorum]MBC9785998.1 tributyrin esterase [Heliobacterium chlorum]